MLPLNSNITAILQHPAGKTKMSNMAPHSKIAPGKKYLL